MISDSLLLPGDFFGPIHRAAAAVERPLLTTHSAQAGVPVLGTPPDPAPPQAPQLELGIL